MKVATMTPKQIAGAERTLSLGTWTITFGAILFSVLTVTPLVERVTPDGWGWTAPILPLVVDSAVVIVIRLDSTVARLGGEAGRWPAILRWLTGLMTVALNIGDSALSGNLVGVGVHLVAPVLLIATGEAGLAYRRAITRRLDEIAREQAEQAERERSQREAREQAAREERERDREARERAEREKREHAEHLETQRAEREAAERREQREHEERLRREEAERQEQERREQRQYEFQREERERAARERREQQERAEREQHEREARERAQAAARERAARPKATPSPRPVNTTATDKLNEADALAAVRAGHAAGDSVRAIADRTGWSVGWVSARLQDLRDERLAA
ncbi:DUF2637 domain-containing protein [Streptomyces sp. NBC_01016]|uniref:DUF2637 domain-containing protein n=1 Tax=Streptomyces sp. NBC_01016 TaxID=2903720 RepID=UPI00225A9F8F|nr:DUF2637 domain-containing protein [Streptomyces sp. NBC_01016]MCX4828734.1 DUF2637 domain-containing protein [Streptomyces sp. NBC_01016]